MIRILISIPLLIILIAFALSNQQPVTIGIWPTDIQLTVPLSVAVLVGAAIFFVLGALMTWTGAVASRGRARRAERRIREMQARIDWMRQEQVEELKTGRAVALAPPA